MRPAEEGPHNKRTHHHVTWRDMTRRNKTWRFVGQRWVDHTSTWLYTLQTICTRLARSSIKPQFSLQRVQTQSTAKSKSQFVSFSCVLLVFCIKKIRCNPFATHCTADSSVFRFKHWLTDDGDVAFFSLCRNGATVLKVGGHIFDPHFLVTGNYWLLMKQDLL